MNLSNLKPAAGSTRDRKRIARGVGSGYGGHSSTKGNKGQKARAGASIPAYFEGGQMPLQRRVPKGGFKNPFRTTYAPVNLERIAAILDDKTGTIDVAWFIENGLAGKNDLIKVLGSGDVSKALNVKAHAFSKSAVAKIEAAGGSTTTDV
jgi:large subunit ribosomal protein L15